MASTSAGSGSAGAGTFSGASSAMRLLVDHGIARETTGRQRDRLFVYDEYVAVLNEGTEIEEG